MGVTWIRANWLVFGGLAGVFAGARIFDTKPGARLALLLLGAAAVLAGAVLHAVSWRRAIRQDPDGSKAAAGAEAVFALASAGCVLALVGFLLGTQGGFEWLGLDLGGPREDRRFRRFFLVSGAVLMACSVLPAAAGHWAAKKGGSKGARRVDAIRIRETASSALSLAIAGAALMLFGYIASERNRTIDFSYFKTATPGDATREIVRNLDGQLRIALFFPALNPVKEEVLTYARALAETKDDVTVEEYDRFADPAVAAEFDARNDGTVFFRIDDRREQIALPVELDDARSRLRVLDGYVQQVLLRLARGERIAYLTTGHGELNDPLVQDSLAPNYAPLESWMPADAPPGPELPPLSVLRRMLELLNYRVLDLGARDGLGDRIPDNAAIVMVLGPQRPFFDSEADALRAYLDRGGALLVALEAGSEFRIDEFRDRLGIDHDPVTVVDDQSHMRETGSVADRRLIVTSRYSAHPAVTTISRRGAGGGVLFLGAEALTPAEDVSGLRHSQLVRSTPWSFADRNGNFRFDEEAESRASMGLAIAVEADAPDETETPNTPGMRALVFGDAEIFSDRVLATLQLNAVMVADGIRWLGKEEAFAGEVVSEADVPIVHTRAEDVAWFYAIIFGAPLLVVAGGALALYGRRAKPGAST